jgi:diphthine synthase
VHDLLSPPSALPACHSLLLPTVRAAGKHVYEPPRYMSVNTAAQQLLELEERLGLGVCTPGTLAIGIARLGAPDQLIVSGTLAELVGVEFGAPLHSLILPGEVHDVEADALAVYSVAAASATAAAAAVEAEAAEAAV